MGTRQPRLPSPLSLVVTLLAWGSLAGLPGPAQAARDLTLEQALELAAQHSPMLKASRQDVQSAEAQRTIAGSAYLPKIEATETFTNTNNPSQVFGTLLNQGRFTQAGFAVNNLNRPSPVENYRFQLSLVQPVYNGGRERLGMEMAELGQSASEEGFQNTRQRVLFSVTRAYYDLVLAKALLTIARQTVQIAESNAKQIQTRLQGGVAVKSELLQAQVRLATLREEAIRAEQAQRVAAITLRHAIGLDDRVDATEALAVVEARPPELDATIVKALEARPDYRMLAAEAHRAEVGIQLAKSVYLPTFNVQTSYELNNTAPFSPNGSNNYVALGMVSLNLFNGMSDAAQIRKARAQEEKTRELVEAKRREIEVEVVEAYYGFVAARERIAVSEGAVVQAEENLRITRNRYNTGIAPVIDLLTAEFVLNQAKHNRTRALYDERIGHARLELVTGQFKRITG